MDKRYRRPKILAGQIKAQRGRVDGAVDMCIFWGDGTPKCDRALVMNALCFERFGYRATDPRPSLVSELEARGYDLDTLRFSIEKKATPPTEDK